MAKATSNELTVQESRELLSSPVYQTIKTFEVQQRMAQMYVSSTIVPAAYKGNVGNCVIAIDMAQRMGANPLMVMQNLYVVNGNPAWSAKFLISCINTCGRFTPLRYEYKGKPGTKDYGCRAYAYETSDKEHKEPLYGVWVTMDMAEKEGWTRKTGSKWLTMPDMMLIYRAAAFWARAYAPEISMGFLTKEETDDGVNPRVVDFEDVTIPTVDPQAVEAEAEPVAEPQAEPQPATPADAVRAAMDRQTRPRVDTTTGELFD